MHGGGPLAVTAWHSDDMGDGMGDGAYLHMDDVRKAYGVGDARVEVLRGITTDIQKGEVCVLFGPSGSGKSTFLNLVGGLEPPDSAEIVVGGEPVCGLR